MPAESPLEYVNGFQVFHILIVFLGASWKDSANSNRSLFGGNSTETNSNGLNFHIILFPRFFGVLFIPWCWWTCLAPGRVRSQARRTSSALLSVCAAPVSWISLIRTVSPGPGSMWQAGHGCVQILTGHVCAQVPSRLNLSPSSLIPHPHSRDSDCPW